MPSPSAIPSSPTWPPSSGARRELPAVVLGASPRAGVHLLAAARAWASLNGRTYVVPDDVVSLATPVLHHRLILTPEAELDRFTPEQALQAVLSTVPIPR